MNYYLGIDFGTSGARAIVINQENQVLSEHKIPFIKDNFLDKIWEKTLFYLLAEIPRNLRQKLSAIGINGTSATVLLCDSQGNVIDEPILYNDNRAKEILDNLREIVPQDHLVLSATSSLAKLYWWSKQEIFSSARYFLHQADWLAFLLHGKLGISDYHNALKLGYDVENLVYPTWLENLPFFGLLPQILAPGTPIQEVTKEVRDRFDLPENCLVKTGTTDSIAAFLASGITQPGEAVTSLGSTLVLKLLSNKKIDANSYGIYSHRLGDLWLTGGASNTGGAVLKQFFSEEELVNLSSKIDLSQETNLDYYPLLKPGERFPINDANLQPKLEPKPDSQVIFLQGLLESIAKIEAKGYQLLEELGATKLSKVYTAGGGAKNEIWTKIRQRKLQIPVLKSPHTEAAYGTAILINN
jgi:sugar (pentulose or hexulose) kinase